VTRVPRGMATTLTKLPRHTVIPDRLLILFAPQVHGSILSCVLAGICDVGSKRILLCIKGGF
jgi:hypothetical protein